MADLGEVLSAATEYGNQREAEGAASRDEEVTALKAEVDRLIAANATLRSEFAEHMATEHPDLPAVCPPGTDRAGQQIPDGETEAWCTVEEPEPAAFPMIFGGATTNNQDEFEKRNNAWGPIRMTREYDSGNGFRPVDQYSWYGFATRNFEYVAFSADEQKTTSSYRDVANGVHDSKIRAMVDSVRTKLAGKKGVIFLGNEPNAASVDPSAYRDAIEHCLDTFDPPAGFRWGVAFSNFNVWGGGRTEGEKWLPRRPDKPFVVATHCYGRTDYTPADQMIGRSFIPAMRKRPKWLWGIGEISAQESSRKGPWLADFADYVAEQGGSFFLPFDTGVNGSAPIGTSPATTAAVKAVAERYKNNDWS